MIKTYAKWGPAYKVEFNINVEQKPEGEVNIFQFTASDNRCCDVGDRIPLFSMYPDFLHFASGVGSEGNRWRNEPFEISKDYNLIIQQYENNENVWKYEILINGNVIESVENNEPKVFNNVKFYASNPWDSAWDNGYGRVWGMKINQNESGKYL